MMAHISKPRTLTLMVALILLSLAFYTIIYPTLFESEEANKIVWERSGGIIGLSETLIIERGGSVSYSLDGSELATSLSPVEVQKINLMIRQALLDLAESYPAKQGAADYYTYTLIIYTLSYTKRVSWVESGVAEKPIPSSLKEIEALILNISQRLRAEIHNIVEIALAAITNAPTFRFDGIPETLKVSALRTVETPSPHYIVEAIFECRHTGYGDRTGQMLPMVITPHTAKVKIEGGKATSIILDGIWDELNQKPLQPDR